MNARTELNVETPSAMPPSDDVWYAVNALLASESFAKAPRMCHLLSFLIEQTLGGKARDISEYAIGLAVFGRVADAYDTTIDPVVRVQIGRLRSRLTAYYEDGGGDADVGISIPLGSYIPCISRRGTGTSCRRKRLQLAPLRNLSFGQDDQAFVRGVDEELGARLFAAFGGVTPLREAGSGGSSDLLDGPLPPHRLEGSIRVERNKVRASMRLLDTHSGQIVWLLQFDRSGERCMTMQAELAATICTALQGHLANQPRGILPS